MTSKIPSLYIQNGSGLSGKQEAGLVSLFIVVALFTHQSSSWTRLRDEAHLRYKNIVQQFSCHSKHSYLSFDGPVTSAAIQKNKKLTQSDPRSKIYPHSALPKSATRYQITSFCSIFILINYLDHEIKQLNQNFS